MGSVKSHQRQGLKRGALIFAVKVLVEGEVRKCGVQDCRAEVEEC